MVKSNPMPARWANPKLENNYITEVLPQKWKFWVPCQAPQPGGLAMGGRDPRESSFEGQQGLIAGIPQDWRKHKYHSWRMLTRSCEHQDPGKKAMISWGTGPDLSASIGGSPVDVVAVASCRSRHTGGGSLLVYSLARTLLEADIFSPRLGPTQKPVLEKTLESPLACKDIKPVNPKGNQSWIFIGRTDAKAETPVLWPPHAKSWLIGKDSGAGKDWRQEEKGTTGDEMVGWHRRLDGHEFEQAPGVGDGQGSLACCSPWGRKEPHMTEQLNWTEQPEGSSTGMPQARQGTEQENIPTCQQTGYFKSSWAHSCSLNTTLDTILPPHQCAGTSPSHQESCTGLLENLIHQGADSRRKNNYKPVE